VKKKTEVHSNSTLLFDGHIMLCWVVPYVTMPPWTMPPCKGFGHFQSTLMADMFRDFRDFLMACLSLLGAKILEDFSSR